jgi:hypothetical protein
MELLRFRRLIEDEGIRGCARIAWNLAWHPAAAGRVLRMRNVFEKYAERLGAISIVARKPCKPG